MKISIITTSFNSVSTIRDTLESVRNQDYADVEHIIIDGRSSDDTLRAIADFPHVSRILSEKDNGIYDAMNKGLSLASGELIGILNSDDLYVDGTVLSSVAEVFGDKSVDICYADLQYVQKDDLEKVIRTWKAGAFNSRSFYYGWMPPHPTVFVRRRVYEKVGNFNCNLKTAADYELLLRIFVKNKFNIKYLPKTIVKMRTGGASNASLGNRFRANREDRLAWEENQLKPYFFTLYLKPLRKITQFIFK